MNAPDIEMQNILLRIANEVNAPIRASDLWRRASRETGRMTPFAVAAMWDLISEGRLNYDSSAMVTVVPDPA